MDPSTSLAAAGPHAFTLEAEEFVLENGLRLLVLEDHVAPVVSYQVHYAAGSRDERPGITGISHLFEHMMFKGTPGVGPEEFARAIQAQGGQLNAFTTEDNTSYYENLPAAALPLAVRMEADRQQNLLLTEENLTSEREVVRNERLLRTVNTPYGIGRELLHSTAFQRHAYRWPVIGWDCDLVAMTLADCKEYFRTYYAPNNAVVVVSGDCTAADVLRLVEDHYGPLASAPPPPDVVTQEDPQEGERRAEHRKDVEAAALLAGFHIPGMQHADIPPLLVLSHLLSHGESARLYRRFVHSGRAGSVRTDLGLSFLNRDPSLFRVDAVANPGDDMTSLEAEIWQEFDRLQQDGIEDGEVRRALKQLRADFVLQCETAFYRGLQAGLLQVRGDDWRWVNRIQQRIAQVTTAEVERVARSYLVRDNRTVVRVEPSA